MEMITITLEEYEALAKDANWLLALESAGVDNWEGYDEARQIYRDMGGKE